MVVVQNGRQERRAVILLVVVAMLTLLALIGLSFVLYANAQANASRIAREAEDFANNGPEQIILAPGSDRSSMLDLFLGQLIYDVRDDNTGWFSSLRGHSLARTMYGANNPGGLNDKPFSGVGRYRGTSPIGTVDNSRLINYFYFPGDNWRRDPDYHNWQTGNPAPAPSASLYACVSNVPYTYPDLNNVFLAMVRASDAKVLEPSYHRTHLFNPGLNLNDGGNGNWANTEGKYLLMRPRPAEHTGFPLPEDITGDTKNLRASPGGNDSVWIDLGAPVLTTRDSSHRRYKPMFAPLVLDLDGRINFNATGNIVASGQNHAGNMGWGSWEVNLTKLAGGNAGLVTELKQDFLGTPTTGTATTEGKYGASRQVQGGAVAAGTGARDWAKVDFQGLNDPGQTGAGSATGVFNLPGAGGHPAYTWFPLFPVEGYGNGVPVETTTTGMAGGTPNHPSVYNVLRPASGNRLIDPIGMASILRWGEHFPQPYNATSDLLRLCPTFYNDAGITSPPVWKRRYTSTLLSFDVDRPGTTPYVWDPAANPYQLGTTIGAFPTGSNPGHQVPAGPLPRSVPSGSEYDGTTWRSNAHQTIATATALAQHGRLDLNRTLTAFPNADGTSGLLNDSPMFTTTQRAIQDRQNLAADIFTVLKAATGAVPGTTTTTDEYRAGRWLAQLAVNIVDYIDQDDYATPFQWDATSNPNEYVYGTEMPRLVINEVYLQLDNHLLDLPAGPVARDYNLNTWVELHNPFSSDSTNSTRNDCQAILQRGTTPLYQIVIADPSAAAALRDPQNTTGDPDFDMPATPRLWKTMNDWSATTPPPQVVDPVNGDFRDMTKTNKGFYTVGPDPAVFTGGTDPTGLPVTHKSANLTHSIRWQAMQFGPETANAGETPVQAHPTILLRRLACPGLPPNTTAGSPLYNPYITVDFVANNNDQFVNEARSFNKAGAVTPVALAQRQSWGRNQPYTAIIGQRAAQDPINNPAGQPRNTFFRHNAREEDNGTAPDSATTGQYLHLPFDWLTHLDRQLISPMELLHVSAFKPHELTQQFITSQHDGSNRQAFQHYARWLDRDMGGTAVAAGTSTRLYRFLEFAQTKNRAAGVQPGGRVPGLVNINSIWDLEVFQAICDRQAGNRFSDTDVSDVWNAILTTRSPTDGPDQGTFAGNKMPGASDSPFWSLDYGEAAGGDLASTSARGLGNTLLRPSPTSGTTIFEPPGQSGQHPYVRSELLQKVFNRLTTRSNVFAVWLTVGFFEVVDDTTQPVKLGAELGRSTGQNIRYRLFSIVDRSNLEVFVTTSNTNVTAPAAGSAPTNTAITLATYSDSGLTWTVSGGNVTDDSTNRTGNTFNWQVAGTVLIFEPNTDNEETVVVLDASGNAKFLRSHPTGCKVACRGNPGVWARYDRQKDPRVVLYSAVVE